MWWDFDIFMAKVGIGVFAMLITYFVNTNLYLLFMGAVLAFALSMGEYKHVILVLPGIYMPWLSLGVGLLDWHAWLFFPFAAISPEAATSAVLAVIAYDLYLNMVDLIEENKGGE